MLTFYIQTKNEVYNTTLIMRKLAKSFLKTFSLSSLLYHSYTRDFYLYYICDTRQSGKFGHSSATTRRRWRKEEKKVI